MVRSIAVGLLAASVVSLLLESLYDFGGNRGLRIGLLCMALGLAVVILLRKKNTSTG